ncbi:NAD(P)-binding protein [Mycena vulgaris]|nr:NAD(P)-binding protein [Mycena vulgaris]
MSSLWTNFFPPKAKWSATQIPDLSGKVVIVTGGSGGIGKETARVLLTKNAHVYIAARNATRGEKAVKELAQATGKKPVFLKIDLADLKSIKAAAEEFKSKETKLDRPSGVMIPPVEMTTIDGYDLQFGTNVLGHFCLTKLLLPELFAAAQSSPDGKARSFKDGPARRKIATRKLYGQSKFGNLVVSNELARRYADRGIVSIAVNPGNIVTDLQRHSAKTEIFLTQWILYHVSLGALTQLYAGTTPEALQLSGKYMIPWARVGKAHADSDNPEQAAKLWDWLDVQVKDL